MICSVCCEQEAKYKCPACSVETCCLQCVKKHKTDKKCTGQRDKTAFVAMSEYNEKHMLNDYRFLEDVNRKTDVSSRDPLTSAPTGFWRKKQMVTKLQKDKQVFLKLLPATFTRSKQNTTKYNFKSKLLIWHVEWLFPAVCLKFTQRLQDQLVLADVLREMVTSPAHDSAVTRRLRPYVTAVDEGGMHLFIRVPDRPANKPEFWELDLSQSLEEAFTGKGIIEFPSIHVVLGEQAKKYPLVLENECGGDIGRDILIAKKNKNQQEFRDFSSEEFREFNPNAEKLMRYEYAGHGKVGRRLIEEIRATDKTGGSEERPPTDVKQIQPGKHKCSDNRESDGDSVDAKKARLACPVNLDVQAEPMEQDHGAQSVHKQAACEGETHDPSKSHDHPISPTDLGKVNIDTPATETEQMETNSSDERTNHLKNNPMDIARKCETNKAISLSESLTINSNLPSHVPSVPQNSQPDVKLGETKEIVTIDDNDEINTIWITHL